MTPNTPAGRGRPNGRVALGLLLVGLGKPAGFAQFGGTTEAFLASLAPLLGFLIVLAGVIAWSGYKLLGLTFFLTIMCNLLAPAVIADLFCRLWDRRDRWARYANVLNYSAWLMAAALLLLVPVASIFVSFGASLSVATGAVLLVFALYGMWFNWFAARHVLDLSPARALLVMLAVVFGTMILLRVPIALSHLTGMHGAVATLQSLVPAADAAGK